MYISESSSLSGLLCDLFLINKTGMSIKYNLASLRLLLTPEQSRIFFNISLVELQTYLLLSLLTQVLFLFEDGIRDLKNI